MNPKFTYLLINSLTLIFPLGFSFLPQTKFYKKWIFIWPAIIIPAAFFIAWDIWFTGMGIWGFNEKYVLGIFFFNLPLEETLFFICIPYACSFTYHSINIISGRDRISPKAVNLITDVLCGFLLLTALINWDKWYTASAFVVCAVLLLFHRWVWKTNYLGRFYFAYLFILIPFFIVNGVLTGMGIPEEVVWYNEEEFMGFRLGTIPFEDTFYGMALLLLNVTLFEYLQKKKGLKAPSQ